jgi:hypothetical protein
MASSGIGTSLRRAVQLQWRARLQNLRSSPYQFKGLKLIQSSPISVFVGVRGIAVRSLALGGPVNRSLAVAASVNASSKTETQPAETFKKISLAEVHEKRSARDFCEMSNEELLPFAVKDDPGACRERLVREIMAVHNISWDDAQSKMQEIEHANKAFGTKMTSAVGYLASTPYFVGIAASVTAGIVSTPLVFDLETAKLFNEYYVTADVAEEKDLETWLEVGSWTWSWMEPVLGQVSFLLLCLQFARNQMVNLKWRPYSHALRNIRSRRLQRAFPQYNAMVLHQFSVNDMWF